MDKSKKNETTTEIKWDHKVKTPNQEASISRIWWRKKEDWITTVSYLAGNGRNKEDEQGNISHTMKEYDLQYNIRWENRKLYVEGRLQPTKEQGMQLP